MSVCTKSANTRDRQRWRICVAVVQRSDALFRPAEADRVIDANSGGEDEHEISHLSNDDRRPCFRIFHARGTTFREFPSSKVPFTTIDRRKPRSTIVRLKILC